MEIDGTRFRSIVLELIDENPIACGAVLGIANIVTTEEVPSLAVTLEQRPTLKVNLSFVAKHCENEIDIKAVVLHEFSHVLLNHTGRFREMDDALNLALDAVINHIIHRSCGWDYSDFFRRYYHDAEGWAVLLAPLLSDSEEEPGEEDPDPYRRVTGSSALLKQLKEGLEEGRVVADDILDIARECLSDASLATLLGATPWMGNHSPRPNHVPDPAHEDPSADSSAVLPEGTIWIGNHTPGPAEQDLAPELQQALKHTSRILKGEGIWREERYPGDGVDGTEVAFAARAEPLLSWERAAWRILVDFITPDRQTRAREYDDRVAILPVLHEGDRRSFLRSIWNPILPDVQWNLTERRPSGTCQIYLDVSGSMHGELNALVALLNRLRRFIRRPFWAFSTQVQPAAISSGILNTVSTGATSINCVLEHVLATLPDKAVIITDGYIETCDTRLLQKLQTRAQKLFSIVSRAGSTVELDRAGIPCRQLEPYPRERWR